MIRSPRRRLHSLWIGALLAWIWLPTAHSQEAQYRGEFNLITVASDDVRGDRVFSNFSLYGTAGFQGASLALPGFDDARLQFNGWARLQMGDDAVLDDDGGDLTLLFLTARTGPLRLQLGRHHVALGTGRMVQVDGLSSKVWLGDLNVSAFGGLEAPREFDYETGNWRAGARIGYRIGTHNDVGIFFNQWQRNGDPAGQDVGLDGFGAIGPVRLSGRAALSMLETRLADLRVAARWRVNDRWHLGLDGEMASPDLFLPQTSIFSVFSDSQHNAWGGDVEWTPSAYATLRADFRSLSRDASWQGVRAEFEAITYREPNHRSLVGASVRRFQSVEDDGYVGLRVFSHLQFADRWAVSASGYGTHLDEPINDIATTVRGQGSVIFDPTSWVRITASGMTGTTPFARPESAAWLRVGLGYHVDFGQEVGP